MLSINKISSYTTVDFAAEELKKYFRMMMPECGTISIAYDASASDGFRLGLMQDFGLDVSDAEKTALDDIIYIDTDEEGGIIAGDNPRSVLLAVYEYLRQNGCRWLFPGVDGEYIPMKDVAAVKLRYKPSCRCRSYCYEGAVIQQSMLDIIDISPKLGMNTYMMEQRETWHYDHYYDHKYNQDNRAPEPISLTTRIQWKRACEAEIEKRGLMYHNVGHGWTSEPFKDDPEYMNYVALVNGKREIVRNVPVYTNVCMSNPIVRKKICDSAVDYSRHHTNTDYLHVWLADLQNNHCECEECVKKTPSDWYIVLLNEMDEAYTKAGLDNHLVFISYVETIWAPTTERLKNPDRFSMLFAPISRNYSVTLPPLDPDFKLEPYVRNNIVMPKTLTENLEYLKKWREVYDGLIVAFEYHFWRHHGVLDPVGIATAKRINEDIKAYKDNGIDGVIEDGTVRPFFPNGFAFYTYARTLWDISLTLDELAEDYFSHLYGKEWHSFYSYLRELDALFDVAFTEGDRSVDKNISSYYNPDYAECFAKVSGVVEKGIALIKENYNSDVRAQTVAVRLLEYHAEYCRFFADALYSKCLGKEEEALRKYTEMRDLFGKLEVGMERYFDHFTMAAALDGVFKINSNLARPIII